MSHAELDWQDGQPFSRRFGDVYFARGSGLAETQYVFLQQNALERRWQALRRPYFCIGETGFGTGLNFLCAWQLWRQAAPPSARLHFISCERYPLTPADLRRALALWPTLAPFGAQLLAQYHDLPAGMHRFSFDQGRVQLTLLIGDAAALLGELQARVDAWFLDGFAPAKNPELWQPALFQAIAGLTRPSGSFATFSCAGTVRRGLQAAGFVVEKSAGFGRKRTMLKGHLPGEDVSSGTRDRRAIVIGAGIAGCASSHALAARGWEVTLIERHATVAAEASGNPAAMLYPRLAAQPTRMSRLALGAFLYLDRLLDQLELAPTDFDRCGLLQLAFNARERARHEAIAKLGLPTGIVQPLTATQASAVAATPLGMPALHFPRGGWVDPGALCRALVRHRNVRLMPSRQALRLEPQCGGWQVWQDATPLAQAPVVVLAGANDVRTFAQAAYLPLQPVRGQITTLPAGEHSRALACALCSDGYISPAIAGRHCLGATFMPDDSACDLRDGEHAANLAMLRRMAPQLWQAVADAPLLGRAALRAVTPDYLPMVGRVLDAAALIANPPRHYSRTPQLPYYDGLYVCAGHGSKGVVQAPLLAELLAAAIEAEPLPLERELAAALDPNRFLLRQLGLKRFAQGLFDLPCA